MPLCCPARRALSTHYRSCSGQSCAPPSAVRHTYHQFTPTISHVTAPPQPPTPSFLSVSGGTVCASNRLQHHAPPFVSTTQAVHHPCHWVDNIGKAQGLTLENAF